VRDRPIWKTGEENGEKRGLLVLRGGERGTEGADHSWLKGETRAVCIVKKESAPNAHTRGGGYYGKEINLS